MTPTDPPTDTTRRTFLGTAALGLAAVAGCSSEGPDDAAMVASTESQTMSESEMESDATTQAPAPDVPILNYALTLEHLENAFYRDGLETFCHDELRDADALGKFTERVRREVPEYLHTVGDHEAAHVEALTATIEKLGGTPVDEGEYDFGYETPSEFLAVAQALENTGVAAYAGAAPKIVQNSILSAAAGIHSVEARHASFLNLVNDSSPFPKVVDEAKSIEEVLSIAGQFVTSEVDSSTYELGENRPAADRTSDDDTSDLNVLNYALTLEHLENAFYREGLDRFSEIELMNAEVLADRSDELRSAVPGHLETVGDHEAAHVTALRNTVQKLGGDPVSEAEYDFGYTTPSEFLAVAKALENTGVAAYKGAAPTVSNDAVFSAAIGIHSVEARHASFLNELNATSPFPDAVDEPKTMSDVVEIASQFIVTE